MKKEKKSEKKTDGDLPGYKLYPESEDIYSMAKEEKDIDPENISQLKAVNDAESELNEKEFTDDVTGGDLDVPGAEADDEQESIGSEDEENNLYSLGGDNHSN